MYRNVQQLKFQIFNSFLKINFDNIEKLKKNEPKYYTFNFFIFQSFFSSVS